MRTSRFICTLVALSLLLPSPSLAFLDFDKLLEDVDTMEKGQEGSELSEILKELEQATAGATVTFTDVPGDAWFKTYVDWAANKGIVSGLKNPDGTSKGLYDPTGLLTVAAAMKIAQKTAGIDETACTGEVRSAKAKGHWSEAFFRCAAEKGFTLAAADPESPIKRGQVLRLFFEAFDVDVPAATSSRFSDVPGSHPEVGPIEHAAALGIVSGDAGKTTYRPDATLNRAEMAKVAKNFADEFEG